MTEKREPYRTHWLTWFFSAVVLIPTILGFANKFLDLVLVIQGDEDGAFASRPSVIIYSQRRDSFVCLSGRPLKVPFKTLMAPATR